jgi:hypothetical protein
MKITTDLRYDFLIHTKMIKNVEVVYKKKKRFNGGLSAVHYKPFEVNIVNGQSKEIGEHTIHFELAEQITIQFLDGTLKIYQDDAA